jgi:hypothetical protein
MQVERSGNAVFGACLPLEFQELREVLVLADNRCARVCRTVQIRRDDFEVWGVKAEESLHLVITSTQLCGVFTRPVRDCGASVADVTWRHRDGAHPRAS